MAMMPAIIATRMTAAITPIMAWGENMHHWSAHCGNVSNICNLTDQISTPELMFCMHHVCVYRKDTSCPCALHMMVMMMMILMKTIYERRKLLVQVCSN